MQRKKRQKEKRGRQKIGEIYSKTDKDARMVTESNREGNKQTETLTKKKEKETKNTIKTQSELSKCKAPRINKNLETGI